MIPKITFGTDGWRALMARDFTFETVSLVAQAVADTIQERSSDKKKMIVGYDRRFLSRQFAETVAVVYAEAGLDVLMTEDFLPTPTLSWCAKNEPGSCGATVITASHNPPEWNGFKFKETFGGSALPATTETFEKRIATLTEKGRSVPGTGAYAQALNQGKIRTFDPREKYFAAVLSQIDPDLIRTAKHNVAVDVMHGAASGHYAELLNRVGIKPILLHDEENPSFRGVPPEPIGKNIPELCALVKEKKLGCGLATDGDADRLGAVDENGRYFTTQQILSVSYWHMLTHRKKKWNISRSVSTTRMVDLIAERAGMKCIETPVGFKFIAEKMVAGEAQIGGEESGGVGIMDHIPERDGLLTGLLLLEVMASTGKGLAAIYDSLCKEIRPYFFTRLDLHITREQMDSALKRLKQNPPEEWEGRSVDTLLTLDGYKFYLKDGAWVLIRPSGTEPIFRLYAEAESTEATQKLVEACRRFVEAK